jgi:FKBP-type peptidyl-prolyl cis-trans isomerase FkpA
MIKKILSIAILGAAIISNTGCKQEGDFKKLKGLEYKIVKDAHGKKGAIGSVMEVNILAFVDTMAGKPVDTLGDSRKQNMGMPIPQRVDSPRGSGQWTSVLSKLGEGDSAIVQIACDTLLNSMPASMGQKLPPWLKKGNKITIYLSVASVKTMEEYKQESEAKQAEMQKKMQDDAMKQMPVDDKMLQDYFAKNNLKPTKTASGLYYTIAKEGSGGNPKPGQMVTMNYTGKTLDGKEFDSNQDPKFNHVQPFTFPVGQGRVIKGWDEGVMLLKKGSKATFFIPSPLAYGSRDQGPDLPANSILVFDVEVSDIKDAPAPTPGKGMQMHSQQ